MNVIIKKKKGRKREKEKRLGCGALPGHSHPIYVANGDERFLYVIETFGIKKWHFSYLPDGKGAYAWGNFEKNCPSEV